MKLKKLASCLLLFAALSPVLAQTDHSTMNHADHDQGNDSEEADFAEREQTVMPFDLNATLHVFEDTATGGVQRVVVTNPDDTENIDLIRSHLAEEAQAFARGDFGDPSYLHGEDMPGLADLKMAGKKGLLEVSYRDLPDGAELSYTSSDRAVVIALHLWFQAQVIDHGEHATN